VIHVNLVFWFAHGTCIFTDARLGFQQDAGPQWQENVVLTAGGDDHGMDVVLRLAFAVPNIVVCRFNLLVSALKLVVNFADVLCSHNLPWCPFIAKCILHSKMLFKLANAPAQKRFAIDERANYQCARIEKSASVSGCERVPKCS